MCKKKLKKFNSNSFNKINFGIQCKKCHTNIPLLNLKRFFSSVLVAAYYACQSSIVYAQIESYQNASSGHKPIMDAAHNGVPVVHIAPPNHAGVSHNQFEHFNINSNGAILNNSNRDIQTQLAGWIAANPQFGQNSARVIVNEVMSTNPSYLSGGIEVAGKVADVIIANPNGITCDGCGFINTGRASLVVGRPEFSHDGFVESFQNLNGQLIIGEKGLNVTNILQLDLIAKSMTVNGEVWANKLNTVLSSNKVNYKNLNVNKNGNGSGGGHGFALDVKSMGGMYAKQLFIVANDKGLGVNSEGRLSSLESDLILNSNGDIKLKDVFVKNNLEINGSENVILTGKIIAENSINLKSEKDIENLGVIFPKENISINSLNLNNKGELIQNSDNDIIINVKNKSENSGIISAKAEIKITAEKIEDKNGKYQSLSKINLASKDFKTNDVILVSKNIEVKSDSIEIIQTNITTSDAVNLKSKNMIISDNSKIASGNKVNLDSDVIKSYSSEIISNKEININSTSQLVNNNSKIISENNLNINANGLENIYGIIYSIDKLKIENKNIINMYGEIISNGNLKIKSDEIDNSNGKIISATEIDVQATHLLNKEGELNAKDHLKLKSNSILNEQGEFYANNISFQSNEINNDSGIIIASENVILNANSNIENKDGKIHSQTVVVSLSQDASLSNNGGELFAAKNLNLQGKVAANENGHIFSKENININSPSINNNDGMIIAEKNLDITGGLSSNIKGEILANNDLNFNANGQIVNNAQGSIQANKQLTLKAENLQNSQGLIASFEQIEIDSKILDNDTGKIFTVENLSINSRELISNKGVISAENIDLNLNNSQFLNDNGKVISQEKLSISNGSISNKYGTIGSNNKLEINTNKQNLDNSNGKLQGDTATIQSGDFSNQNGVINAGNKLNVNSELFNNDKGIIVVHNINHDKDNEFILETNGKGFSNIDGKIFSNVLTKVFNIDSIKNNNGYLFAKDLSIKIDHLQNNQGIVFTNNELEIETNELSNQNGRIFSNNTLTANISNTIENQQGQINSNGVLNVKTKNLNNSSGQIASLSNLILNANQINNDSGTIHGSYISEIKAESTNNTKGHIYSNGSLVLNSSALENEGGNIGTSQNLKINSNSYSVGGKIISQENMNLNFSSSYTNTSDLGAGGNLYLSTSELTNKNKIQANGYLKINTKGEATNNKDAIIAAKVAELNTQEKFTNFGKFDGESVIINANSIENSAEIVGNNLYLKADKILNYNQGKIVGASADGTVIFLGGDLTNEKGGEILSAGNIFVNLNKLTNISSKIYAAGDISFNNTNVTNKKEKYVTEYREVVYDYSPYKNELLFEKGDILGHKRREKITHLKTTYGEEIKEDSAPGEIKANGDIIFEGNLLNDISVIMSAGTLIFNRANVNNASYVVERQYTENGHFYDEYRHKISFSDGMLGGFQTRHEIHRDDKALFNVVYADKAMEKYTLTEAIFIGDQAFGTLVQTQNVNYSSTHNIVPSLSFSSPVQNSEVSISKLNTENKQGHLFQENGLSIQEVKKENIHAEKPQDYSSMLENKESKSILYSRDGIFLTDSLKNNYQLNYTDLQKYSLNNPENSGVNFRNETDSKYTDYNSFYASDYYFNELMLHPDRLLKKYGDNQKGQLEDADENLGLTGHTFLSNYKETEKQFVQITNVGKQFSESYQISPGTNLSSESMQQLTTNIIANVDEKTNKVETGLRKLSTQDFNKHGGFIAFGKMDLKISDDVKNEGTFFNAEGRLIADNIINEGGKTIGNKTLLSARKNFKNIEGLILSDKKNGELFIKAGNKIFMETKKVDIKYFIDGIRQNLTEVGSVSQVSGHNVALYSEGGIEKIGTHIDVTGKLDQYAKNNIEAKSIILDKDIHSNTMNGGYLKEKYTTHFIGSEKSGSDNILRAGNDINYKGVDLGSNGKLVAIGENINIQAEVESKHDEYYSSVKNSKIFNSATIEKSVGGNIYANDGILFVATGKKTEENDSNGAPVYKDGTGDINLTGIYLNSKNSNIMLNANNDVNVTSQVLNHKFTSWSVQTREEAVNSFASSTNSELNSQSVTQSVLSANNVFIKAGNKDKKQGNINVQASQLVASQNILLDAGKDINIVSQKLTSEGYSHSVDTTTGLMGTSVFNFTVGQKDEKHQSASKAIQNIGSTVATQNGNISMDAGGKYYQEGSNLFSQFGSVEVEAESIKIVNTKNTYEGEQGREVAVNGLNVGTRNEAVTLGQNLYNNYNKSQNTNDPRMQSILGVSSGLSVSNTLGPALAKKDPKELSVLKVTTGVGGSSQEDSTNYRSDEINASSINAGHNVSLKARGAGADSKIIINGSDIKAKNKTRLFAEGNVNINADNEMLKLSSDSLSYSWQAGAAFNIKAKGVGIAGEVTGALGQSGNNKSEVAHRNSNVEGLNGLEIVTGGDLDLIGGSVRGSKVTGSIKGNLYIESLQDLSEFTSDAKSGSTTGTLCLPPVCAGHSGASFTYSQTNMDSYYQSVGGQSGIFAGSEGFQVEVGGHTHLKGAVIASNEEAIKNNKNTFETGTVSYENISNKAWYEASQISGAGSVGTVDNSVVSSVPLYLSDSISNTTYSGISAGSFIIRDDAKQRELTGKSAEQTIADINRDTSNTHEKLPVIFDEQKITTNFQIVSEFNTELNAFINNQANKHDSYKREVDELLERGADPNSTEVKEAQSKLESAEKWGPGGSYRQIVQALSLAVSGNVGGSNIDLIKGVAANYFQSLGAQKVKELAQHLGGEGSPAHVALHALLGCVAGSLKGTCEQTAVGAAAGVVINELLKEDKELTAEEKEKKLNITRGLVGSLAAALGEKNVAAVTSGAQIESENNAFFIPPVVIWIASTGLTVFTANEIASDVLEVSEGNKTFEELLKEYGEAGVVNFILDKTTRGLVKQVQAQIKKTKIGKDLDEKIDNFYEKGRAWLEKKGYSPEKISFVEQQIEDVKDISKGRLSVKELVDKHGEGYLEGLKDNLISKNIHIKKSEEGTYSILHTDPKTGKVSEIEQRVPNNKPQQPENKELDLKILAENEALKESSTEKLDTVFDKENASVYLGVNTDKVIENWDGVEKVQKVDQFLKEQPELQPILDKWGVGSLEKKGAPNQLLQHIFDVSYKNRILEMEKSFNLPAGHLNDVYKLNDSQSFKKGIENFDKLVEDSKKFTINSKLRLTDSDTKYSLIKPPAGKVLYIKIEYKDKLQTFYPISNIKRWENLK